MSSSTARKSTARKSTARKADAEFVTRHSLSNRLQELAAETNLPEPYQVTDDIVVDPPTRTRRQAMHEAELQLYLTQELLATALASASEPHPARPAEFAAVEPDDLADDATDEQRDEYAKALGAWLIRRSYEDAAERWATRRAELDATVEAINAKIVAADDAYNRAFFGDTYDAVIEYFEDKPTWWDVFIPDIKAEFLPKAPANGKCPTCGTVTDVDAAKKAPASST